MARGDDSEPRASSTSPAPASDGRRRLLIYALVTAVFVAVSIFRNRVVRRRADASPSGQQEQPDQPAFPFGPAGVRWVETIPSLLKLHPSSFECAGADPAHMVCTFRNLILYRGELTYIVKDAKTLQALKLPEPEVFEVGNSPTNDFSLPEILRVLTLAAAMDELGAAATGDALRVARFDSAIFQRTRTFGNWFWVLNGAGNIYHRLCKHMGVCTAEDVRRAAVLQPIIKSSSRLRQVGYIGLPRHHSAAAQDLMSCFGPLLWVNHQSGRQVKGRPGRQVVVLRRVLVGIGDDVVQPKAALTADGEVRYAQANASMALRRVQFLRRCAGLPADPPPSRRHASVLLVNRPFSDGRSILGLDDVADRLRRELPEEIPVKLYLPRGEVGLAAQAAEFDAATVVVAPHGAATANFHFLPHDAVALGVFALLGRFGHDAAVGASLPAPPYNVTVLPVDCSAATDARVGAAAALEAFAALTGEEQEGLLAEGEMSAALAKRVHALLGMSLLDWLEFRSYHPDPGELAHAVVKAVGLWEEKVEARQQLQRRRQRRRRRE